MNCKHFAALAGLSGLVLALAAVGGGRAAEEAPATIVTQESNWDVFLDNQKDGRLHLKILLIRDLVIIDTSFTTLLKGKEMGFTNQIVYKDGNPPRPVRGKVTTNLGTLKMMDGTAVFSDASAKIEGSIYVDKEQKPLQAPQAENKDVPVPSGLVLTYPAFMHFATKLLPETGQLPKVAFLKFPANVAFSDILAVDADCVLARGPAGADGRVGFVLKRVFAGGNAENMVAMTVDKKGQILEVRRGQFAFRPASDAAAPAPAPAAPVAPVKTPKAGKK
ncbi:MAG: hypothetical protein NT049_09865 [Planctomycetota bacterium]|nr:hypothetical protein [Planctomycetota bacterium]